MGGDGDRVRFDPDDPDAPWDHERIDVGDVTLHCAVAGPADGECVLLLHGFPECWYAWRHQVPALADAGYRAVAPDMRGFNRSDAPEGVDAYHLDALVGDVAGVVDALGCDSVHLVGHDWGGIVGWAVGDRRPGLLDRLAILNAPHPATFERAYRECPDQRRKSRYLRTFLTSEEPEAALTADDCRRVREILATGSGPGAFTDRELAHFRRAFCREGVARAAVHYYRANFDVPGDDAIVVRGFGDRTVDVPTLVCWGERDPALTTAILDGLDAWVSDLRVERFPRATHWVQADAPADVTDRLLAFFDGD